MPKTLMPFGHLWMKRVQRHQGFLEIHRQAKDMLRPQTCLQCPYEYLKMEWFFLCIFVTFFTSSNIVKDPMDMDSINHSV